MSTLRTSAVLLLSLGLTACGPFSPEVQQTNAYLKDLQPLLVENGHLAERVLVLASDVYNKKGDADALAESWTSSVVPLAEHLHHQAQFVDAPEPWVEEHGELVEIWGDRALAYRSLSEALILADLDAWKTARSQATKVKLREEEWFKEVNAQLAPNGMVIDPTP